MFKLEYLPDGSADCPLIRLYDHFVEDVVLLREACMKLANGEIMSFTLDSQQWVKPIDGCRLTLECARDRSGVRVPAPGEPFILELGREGWERVCDILEPFVEGAAGYNWLADDSEVNVLISCSGQW